MSSNILITGPTNGIGRATALDLAKRGNKLFLLCRNEQLGRELCEEIEQISGAPKAILLIADLAKMNQVRAAVETFLALNEPLHMLINNAGVVNDQRFVVTVEGSEQEHMFAVNHLGHFLLTRLLLPTLLETAEQTGIRSRLIVVASEAHALFCKGLDFEDLNLDKKFTPTLGYGRSKLANILMTKSLSQRVDSSKLQVNCLHPGAVNSNFGANIPPRWYTRPVFAIMNLFFISAEQGAATTIYLATEAIDTQGEYYVRKKLHRVKPWGLDMDAAQRLWDVSETILGLPADLDSKATS